MTRTLLDYCSEKAKPVIKEQAKAEAPAPSTPFIAKAEKNKLKKPRTFPPMAPENLPPSYFVSASYDGRQKKAVIKLYEPESGEIYFWYDNTGHKPYCLTNLTKEKLSKFDRIVNHEGFYAFEKIKKFDPLENKVIDIVKIIAKDPLTIGGRPTGTIRDIIPEDYPNVCGCRIEDSDTKVWESKIKYYQSYIYDRQLLPGMIYEVKDNNLIPKLIEEATENLNKIKTLFNDCTDEERYFAEMWAKLLEYPAPKFRRAAVDIEVYSPLSTRMPDAREAACPVIAVSVYSSDGEKKVLILKREGLREGNQHLAADIDIEYCETEEDLLKKTFAILSDYPFILTFNGDDFDLRYLTHRAMNLGFRRNEIPIEVGKRVCLLKYGVHIDLYKFFFNRSVQIYAFGGRYKDVSLDDVGNALIGVEKIH
ncbi:MAG TPA: 3'-5' exonuclease, partial [Candidatus Acidoferrum sp.]|nr:3'-5' exonuclease [Candidatus Acidoferrum sp.]